MKSGNKGFIYLWALFAAALAGIMMAGTGQVWQITSQREKEKELLFVGDQFRQAVMSYYNDSPGEPKQYPESLEQLLEDKRAPITKRHLRKVFIDPMTNATDWGLVAEPETEQEASSGLASSRKKGFIGVYSLSKKIPLKIDNFKEHNEDFTSAATYQDWAFVFTQEAASGNASSNQKNQQPNASSSSPFGSPSSANANTSSQGLSSPPAQPSSGTNQNPFLQ